MQYAKGMERVLIYNITNSQMFPSFIQGRVVTVTGSTGNLSLPGQSALCISNFGLEAFNDALRLETQPFGVRVITVRPGNFVGATGMLNKSGVCGYQVIYIVEDYVVIMLLM